MESATWYGSLKSKEYSILINHVHLFSQIYVLNFRVLLTADQT